MKKEKFKEHLRNISQMFGKNFMIQSKPVGEWIQTQARSQGFKAKCITLLWNTFFLTHIYILVDKSTKKYKIFDIVCTNNQDKGEEVEQNSYIEAKNLFDSNSTEAEINLQVFLFNTNRAKLVFKPSNLIYQKFTNWIRFVYFRKKIEVELENLVLNYIKPYKEILLPAGDESRRSRKRCANCQEKMKFISLKEGFMPPTIYIHNTDKFYHEKCFPFDSPV